MLYNIPIESLEERYSKDWNRYFPAEFCDYNLNYVTIYPQPLTSKIQQGSFLDVCGTNYFKAMQLAEICKLAFDGKIKDGDIFFMQDAWFPGIEMLAYIRDALGIDFKICGILHAGTYDPHDFLYQKGMSDWGRDLENSWFTFFDAIFVATEFHKELICSSRTIHPDKIHVTYLPIYPGFVNSSITKENIVVFPHRLDPEKAPQVFDKLADILKPEFPNWKFIKTAEVCHTKQEYYLMLNKSKIAVSTALQETWGIAMQEATLCGCFPLVPDRLSYPEMYRECFRHSNFNLLLHKTEALIRMLNNQEKILINKIISEQGKKFISEGSKAISRMIDIMRKL